MRLDNLPGCCGAGVITHLPSVFCGVKSDRDWPSDASVTQQLSDAEKQFSRGNDRVGSGIDNIKSVMVLSLSNWTPPNYSSHGDQHGRYHDLLIRLGWTLAIGPVQNMITKNNLYVYVKAVDFTPKTKEEPRVVTQPEYIPGADTTAAATRPVRVCASGSRQTVAGSASQGTISARLHRNQP